MDAVGDTPVVGGSVDASNPFFTSVENFAALTAGLAGLVRRGGQDSDRAARALWQFREEAGTDLFSGPSAEEISAHATLDFLVTAYAANRALAVMDPKAEAAAATLRTVTGPHLSAVGQEAGLLDSIDGLVARAQRSEGLRPSRLPADPWVDMRVEARRNIPPASRGTSRGNRAPAPAT